MAKSVRRFGGRWTALSLAPLALFVALLQKVRFNVPLRLQLFDTVCKVAFRLNGLRGICHGPSSWRNLLGMDGRSSFELMTRLADRSAHPGNWDGVSSVDVDVPLASGGAVRTRVFTPDVAKLQVDGVPVALWIHGGGWTVGHYDDPRCDAVCRELASRGPWVVISPEYRLAPEHPFPQGLRDVHAVAMWTSAAAHEALQHGDGSRLIVGGDSAGGNLAAVVSLLARDGVDPDGTVAPMAVSHQLLVYPGLLPADHLPSRSRPSSQWVIPPSIMTFFESAYLGGDEQRREELQRNDLRVSPLAASHLDGLPGATFVHAEHDPLIDEGRLYAERLRKAGVRTTELIYPRMVHAFFCLQNLRLPDTQLAVTEAVAAVNDALWQASQQSDAVLGRHSKM